MRNLKEHLTDLCLATSPQDVIVTVDLRDMLKAQIFDTCVNAVQALKEIGEQWLEDAAQDSRIKHLPNRIIPVVQVQTFETWFIADVAGLKLVKFLSLDSEQPEVVDEIESPSSWIIRNGGCPRQIKNPTRAKALISSLSLDRMRQHSRSFEKLCKECCISFDNYEDNHA